MFFLFLKKIILKSGRNKNDFILKEDVALSPTYPQHLPSSDHMTPRSNCSPVFACPSVPCVLHPSVFKALAAQ